MRVERFLVERRSVDGEIDGEVTTSVTPGRRDTVHRGDDNEEAVLFGFGKGLGDWRHETWNCALVGQNPGSAPQHTLAT